MKPAQVFKKKIPFLGIIKIIVIILASVYLIGGFAPFYFGSDAHLYGIGAVNIVNDSYEYTNEFLQNTDYGGFYFDPFIKTIHDTLIPHGAIGIYGPAAISYFLGGYYGLFYLGPIITILFLIISERVISKFFGGFAGLVALIFLSTDSLVLEFGRNLLTDTIFGLLLILACFFLINFLKKNTYSSILLCSSFLTAATFFRFNGAIFLPIEIFIIFSYFLFKYIKNKENIEIKNSSNQFLNLIKPISKIEIKKILKISLYILGPWSIFFIFLFSYNTYFFGEPFTTYWEEYRDIETESLISSFHVFDSERFESIKLYSAEFLPDQTNFLVKTISFKSILLDKLLQSIISFSLIFLALFISLKFRIKRIEIIVFTIFILGLLAFYSSSSVVSITKITERYMIPILPLSFGIIGYLMYIGWKINYQRIFTKYHQKFSISWKGFLIIIFALILFSSLYYSKPVQLIIVKQDFVFKNPQVFAERYPLDEGFTEKSVIFFGKGRATLWEYNAIPFNPFKSSEQAIQVINELLDEGYELYVFKEKDRGVPSFYKDLETEQGLILKEHSETFCKLIRIENTGDVNNEQIQSDAICHSFWDPISKKFILPT